MARASPSLSRMMTGRQFPSMMWHHPIGGLVVPTPPGATFSHLWSINVSLFGSLNTLDSVRTHEIYLYPVIFDLTGYN
jgi:hypothetical protein